MPFLEGQTILLTGAAGFLGSHIAGAVASRWPDAVLASPARHELDLTDHPAVGRWWSQWRPAAVIHCAALSRAAACEAKPDQARLNNVEATNHLAELAAGVPLVFLSTDLVFDGRRGSYVETDAPRPLSVYGETKLAAEQAVLAHPRHTVLRVSLAHGRSPDGARSFNEDLERAWRAGRKTTLFTDEYRTPIPAPVLARVVCELLGQGAAGLFHVAGAERLSRWQIGELLVARHPEFHPLIQRGSLRDYDGPPRPADVSLNCAKVQALLSFPLPRFSDWLASGSNAQSQT
jgi:dTDP-4-dehydrorhamnose reductase